MGPSAAAQDRPNIILFLVDDMGWQETSVPFYRERTPLNDRYRTPNMERMARMGVKFTQAYACAISSPSRCSLMSGMNAARHRVTNWTLEYNTKTDAPSSVITLPDWNYNGIQPAGKASERDLKNSTAITSLPQLLQDNGYYTIHCGKAHFAARGTAGEDPLNFGFNVNIAGAANGAPGSYLAENEYGTGSFHVSGLEQYYQKGTFLTEALTLEALKAIEVPIARKQPFYLYMSHYAIHAPYDADKRFTPHYQTADGQGVYDSPCSGHRSTARKSTTLPWWRAWTRVWATSSTIWSSTPTWPATPSFCSCPTTADRVSAYVRAAPTATRTIPPAAARARPSRAAYTSR